MKTIKVKIYNTGKEYTAIIKKIGSASTYYSVTGESLIDVIRNSFDNFYTVQSLNNPNIIDEYELAFFFKVYDFDLSCDRSNADNLKTIKVKVYNTGKEYAAVIENLYNVINYKITGNSVEDVIKQVMIQFNNFNKRAYLNNRLAFIFDGKSFKTEDNNQQENEMSNKTHETFYLMYFAKMTLTEINTLSDKERSDLYNMFHEQQEKKVESKKIIFDHVKNDLDGVSGGDLNIIDDSITKDEKFLQLKEKIDKIYNKDGYIKLCGHFNEIIFKRRQLR